MINLDTNAVIAAINQRTPHVRRRLELALLQGTKVGTSSIVLHELWFGINKSSRRNENATSLAIFLTLDVVPLMFDSEDAEEAGEIRAMLERAGTPIGPYDTLIAGQARRRGALLVTANRAEFARVPGLLTEDWASA